MDLTSAGAVNFDEASRRWKNLEDMFSHLGRITGVWWKDGIDWYNKIAICTALHAETQTYSIIIQESCAIAKMTARCALYK